MTSEKQKGTSQKNSGNMQVITFSVGDQFYGVNVLVLDEIIPLLQIKPIPKGPDFLEGVINLRGEIIPVVDFVKICGYEREKLTLENRIVVCNLSSHKVGFIIDGVKSVEEFSPETIQKSVVNSESATFIESIAKLDDGRMVQLVDMNRTLDENMLRQISGQDYETDA